MVLAGAVGVAELELLEPEDAIAERGGSTSRPRRSRSPPRPTTIASQSFARSDRSGLSEPDRRALAHVRDSRRPVVLGRALDELDPAADLDRAVGLRPDEDLGADALADRDRPRRGQPPITTAAAPVASSSTMPDVRREVAGSEDARRPRRSRPRRSARLAHRRPGAAPRRRPRSASSSMRDRVDPLGPGPDPRPLAVVPERDLAGRRRAASSTGAPVSRQSQAVPTVGWPANGSSRPGVKIRIAPVSGSSTKTVSREAELGGDRLAPLRRRSRRRRGRRRAGCRRGRPARRRPGARGAWSSVASRWSRPGRPLERDRLQAHDRHRVGDLARRRSSPGPRRTGTQRDRELLASDPATARRGAGHGAANSTPVSSVIEFDRSNAASSPPARRPRRRSPRGARAAPRRAAISPAGTPPSGISHDHASSV